MSWYFHLILGVPLLKNVENPALNNILPYEITELNRKTVKKKKLEIVISKKFSPSDQEVNQAANTNHIFRQFFILIFINIYSAFHLSPILLKFIGVYLIGTNTVCHWEASLSCWHKLIDRFVDFDWYCVSVIVGKRLAVIDFFSEYQSKTLHYRALIMSGVEECLHQ